MYLRDKAMQKCHLSYLSLECAVSCANFNASSGSVKKRSVPLYVTLSLAGYIRPYLRSCMSLKMDSRLGEECSFLDDFGWVVSEDSYVVPKFILFATFFMMSSRTEEWCSFKISCLGGAAGPGWALRALKARSSSGLTSRLNISE